MNTQLSVVKAEEARRKLKILMLHGYTQSGPLFHAKTRALEKQLHKAFPAASQPSNSAATTKHTKSNAPPSFHLPAYPGGIQLIYPTAPIRLQPADIPGFRASEFEGNEPAPQEESDAWGWWKRETGSGLYIGLDEGLRTIANTIKDSGGIDGVMGFSQGAAAAVFVASLLEPGRESAFREAQKKFPDTFTIPDFWQDIRALHPNGLRFAVVYAGFYAPHAAYQAFYEPPVRTPVLHFVGSLDSVVEEHRSTGVIERCDEKTRRVVSHPGGHFVPVGKEMAGVLVGWLKDLLMDKEGGQNVVDMEVPF